MAESDIFCAKLPADPDAAIENWLQLFFVEILALPCPKNALQNMPEKPVVYTLLESRCGPTATVTLLKLI